MAAGRQAGRQVGRGADTKPEMLRQVDADIATLEQRLEELRRLKQQLETCYEWEQSERPRRRAKGVKASRRPRGARGGPRRMKRQPLRTVDGRRTPLAAGSLGDRIIEVLTKFGAPMRKRALVEDVKAPPDAVTAELKRLRAADRVKVVGVRAGARYAVPKFAHVIVAEDAA